MTLTLNLLVYPFTTFPTFAQLTEHILAVHMEQHLRSRGLQVRISDYGNAWELVLFNQRKVSLALGIACSNVLGGVLH